MERPANAGKPWTSEEDTKLVRAFEAGATLGQLARQHGRTQQAIQGRLYRLGKVGHWQLTAPRDGEPERVGVRQQPVEGTPAAAAARGRLDGLNAAARAVVRANFSPDELPFIFRAEVASLQRAFGQEIVFCDGREGVWFAWKTRRPDSYASVRKPNEVRFLSGQIDGVWVVVNLHKPGAYRHENAHVAEALRALAEAVERAEVPLADHDMQLRVEG
jgi:hypothetical protein